MAQGDIGIYASQISGHLWAPNGAYDALATVTVPVGGVSSITFSGIPQGYKHLQIRAIMQVTSTARMGLSFNSDTTLSNYNVHFVYGDGVSAGAGYGANQWGAGLAAQNGSIFGGLVCDILDYTNTSKNKVWRSLGGQDQNGSGYSIMYSGLWRNTAAVSSLTLYPSETGTSGGTFTQYSSFALYGIK